MKWKYLVLILVLIGLICGTTYLVTRKDFNRMTVTEKVDYLMNEMTIEEKIAQMLILYYINDHVDDNLNNILSTVKPGGFIVIGENITTFAKTKKFIDDLKKSSDIPMIISIDQEGGSVQRLKYIEDKKVTEIPYMYYLGKTNDQKLAYDVGRVMAEEMRTLGINVVYGPVCDILSNEENTVIGKRSFGETATLVSDMATNLAKGLEANGVIATYKHFPGHGNTSTDSHNTLPIIDKDYEELLLEELIPFKSAIDNGAKIIMIGHLSLPQITNDSIPASLSPIIINDILKDKMGYEGLVITDALNMGALTNTYSDEEIYTMAINAGVDLLLMPSGSKNAIKYIKDNIKEERINESVKKILTFKYTYLNNDNVLDESYLNGYDHENVINKIPIAD